MKSSIFLSILVGVVVMMLSGCASNLPPLQQAVINHDTDEAKRLIENGADVNSVDSMGIPIFHWAAFNDNKDIVDLFIQKGVDVNNKDSNGNTLLHNAAIGGDIETARLLVKHGANINARTSAGITPLMSASMGNQVEMINFLKKSGAKTALRDIGGLTAADHRKAALREKKAQQQERERAVQENSGSESSGGASSESGGGIGNAIAGTLFKSYMNDTLGKMDAVTANAGGVGGIALRGLNSNARASVNKEFEPKQRSSGQQGSGSGGGFADSLAMGYANGLADQSMGMMQSDGLKGKIMAQGMQAIKEKGNRDVQSSRQQNTSSEIKQSASSANQNESGCFNNNDKNAPTTPGSHYFDPSILGAWEGPYDGGTAVYTFKKCVMAMKFNNCTATYGYSVGVVKAGGVVSDNPGMRIWFKSETPGCASGDAFGGAIPYTRVSGNSFRFGEVPLKRKKK